METHEAKGVDTTATERRPVTRDELRRELTSFGLLYVLMPLVTLATFFGGVRLIAYALALVWIAAAIRLRNKPLAIGVTIALPAVAAMIYAMTGRLF